MSFHVKITWSSGAVAEYSGEASKEQFLTSFFGHHERLPDGVVITDVPQEVEPTIVEPTIVEPVAHEPAPKVQEPKAVASTSEAPKVVKPTPTAVKVDEKKDVK